MSDRPSTPELQTQRVDFDPRTPPPAPNRGRGRTKDPPWPGNAYSLFGNQVPGATTDVNAGAGYGMTMSGSPRMTPRTERAQPSTNGYRMSSGQIPGAYTTLYGGTSFETNPGAAGRDADGREAARRDAAGRDAAAYALRGRATQGNGSEQTMSLAFNTNNGDWYGQVRTMINNAGFGDNYLTLTSPQMPNIPSAGGVSETRYPPTTGPLSMQSHMSADPYAGLASGETRYPPTTQPFYPYAPLASGEVQYTPTRPAPGHGSQSSMQLPQTPTSSAFGDRSGMGVSHPRRNVSQAPTHLRNHGHGQADRLSALPPVPPTPADPSFGATVGNPNDVAAFGNTRPGPLFGMATSVPRFNAPSIAGVVKSRVAPSTIEGSVQKKRRTAPKYGDLSITMNDSGVKQLVAVFPFLDLPSEIRNMVYKCLTVDTKQALLVHCQRMASLRDRTRIDRGRALPDLDPEDEDKPKGRKAPLERKNNRPSYALAQTCRQLRNEFWSFFLAKQEIGLDITNVDRYLRTFYDKRFLTEAQLAERDMPFNGNLTIAISWRVLPVEKTGVEIVELLIAWACSTHMEAGFGRYSSIAYNPHTDGEAKDLYRLFGRVVQPDRSCGPMNRLWRRILRGRWLASVTVHRDPPTLLLQAKTGKGPIVSHVQRPYFHILFKPQHAEPWMTSLSVITPPAGWLNARGFGGMEHFRVRVGRWQPGHYTQNFF